MTLDLLTVIQMTIVFIQRYYVELHGKLQIWHRYSAANSSAGIDAAADMT